MRLYSVHILSVILYTLNNVIYNGMTLRGLYFYFMIIL